jgi:hypothetical protein
LSLPPTGPVEASPASCNSWLSVVRPRLAEALFRPSRLEHLSTLARQLPGDGIYVLEARLAAGNRTVDLSLGFPDRLRARPFAHRFSPPHLGRFLSRWCHGDEALAPVSAVWLEFDRADEPFTQLPEPVICAKLRHPSDPRWLTDELFPALQGRPLRPQQRRMIHRCAAQIPTGGRILYAFSLVPRPGDRVRLELYGLDPPAMADYLKKLVPARLVRRVEELLPIVRGCERHHLSFDLDDEIAPRIGLEAGFVRLPHREPRWAKLFDRLVDNGFCTVEKRRAVFAWPGYDTRASGPETWPTMSAVAGGYCVRCLSHVKLISSPNRPPEAKVYLLFQYLEKKRTITDMSDTDTRRQPEQQPSASDPSDEPQLVDEELDEEELENVAGGWSKGPADGA